MGDRIYIHVYHGVPPDGVIQHLIRTRNRQVIGIVEVVVKVEGVRQQGVPRPGLRSDVLQSVAVNVCAADANYAARSRVPRADQEVLSIIPVLIAYACHTAAKLESAALAGKGFKQCAQGGVDVGHTDGAWQTCGGTARR